MSAQLTAALASTRPLQVLRVQIAAETGPLSYACRLMSCAIRPRHPQALALRVLNAKSKHAGASAPPAISTLQNAGRASQQLLIICTAGVNNQRRSPRSSSRHDFCGHTSEFPASTFATADLLQHALVLVSAGDFLP